MSLSVDKAYLYQSKTVGYFRLPADAPLGMKIPSSTKPNWFRRKLLLWCLNIGWEDEKE